jgi:high affinity sulfate transporter 1
MAATDQANITPLKTRLRTWLSKATAAHPHLVPMLVWLPKYDRTHLRSDAIAGLTVWGMGIPSALAYAQLAGVPPQAGLYSMMIGMLVYAVFSTSRQMKVTMSSTMAVMSAAVIAPLAGGDPNRYWVLTSALALVVGLILLFAGIIKLGFIADFLAKPVVTGYVFGLAIVVLVGQLPKLFGVPAGGGDVVQQLIALVTQLGNTNPYAFLLGAGALILILVLKRTAPALPAPLIALALGIALSASLSLHQRGVSVVGEIPLGLPSVSVPFVSLSDLTYLIVGAAGIVFLAAGESLGTARAFAIRHRYDVDADQELIAMGVTNVGTGLAQGTTVDASMSTTATADAAGAKSQLSGLVTAGMVLVTLLFLARLFTPLPNAVLAAVVISAVLSLMDVGELKRYYRWRGMDWMLAIIALIGVVLTDVLTGLTVAVLLSLMLVVYRASRPYIAVLGKVPNQRGAYGDIKRHPENEQVPGLIIYRLDAPLFFANASVAQKEIRDTAARVARSPTPPRAVVIDLGASADLDIASLDMLRDLVIELREAGIETFFAQVHGSTRDRLRKTGLMQEIGHGRVYHSVEAAVEDLVHRYEQAPQTGQTPQPDQLDRIELENTPADPADPSDS